ncbi:hypothetical protein Tco_0252935 [Tanacetum coccineum]
MSSHGAVPLGCDPASTINRGLPPVKDNIGLLEARTDDTKANGFTDNRKQVFSELVLIKQNETSIQSNRLFQVQKDDADSRYTMASLSFLYVPRGTEFLNKTLNAFFKEEGIEHQTSTSYEHALNRMRFDRKTKPHSRLAPPRQMTSDHNSSELGIHDHSNELSSSKLVPKVVPPVDKTTTSRQELKLLFQHHITMLFKKILNLTVKQTLEEGQNQPENVQELLLKLLNDLQILNKMQLKQEDQATKICTSYWKPPIFYDDDDDESFIPLKDIISELPLSIAITPDFPITDSLIMEDEHLDTIPKTESDEENESSVEDLNLNPSESEDLSDIESECDMPVCDDFMTFSNPLFDSNDDFTSSDDESLSDEDVPEENFKIYPNPVFDEEIISTKIDPHHFNAESDLIESLLNRDTSMVSSPKFDSLLEEFFGELTHIDLISPEINESDFDSEEDIRLVEKLLYHNSSPRPPEELNSENSDAIIESFSPSPIPVEDSEFIMEEIDIFLAPDDSIPMSIENDDYDWEGDILFLEELLSNDSLSLPENESFHFDRYYDPSSPRPPVKPPDDDEIHFDIEPDMGILTAKVVDDNSEHYVLMPSILPTHPICFPVIDTLLPFSSENENKIFNSSILASNEEKYPHLLSHRGFKAFQIIFDFSESPMMIYRGDSPILDV